jgi:large conductance mechanosensitive channel
VKILQEFKTFAVRGNVIDLAIGVIVGSAFGKIVTSIVEDVVMPPIGLLLGGVNFTDLFWVLDSSKAEPASLADAKANGVAVLAYGQFINTVINFLIIAFCVFLLVKGINALRRKKEEAPADPSEKECPYCLKAVPIKATRCAHCTSHLEASAADGVRA